METQKDELLKTKLSKVNFDVVERILLDFGLEKGTRYCEIHKQNYGCIIDKKTGEKSGCPICEKEAEEKELQQERIYHSIDGVLKKYSKSSFQNYEIKYITQQKIKKEVLSYAMNPTNRWLFMLGSNGTGKTHLAHAILKQIGGIYREFDDISCELLDSQAKGEGEVGEIINKYSNCKMLIIDEIDKVKNTDGRVRWLNVILRKRYNNLLPLVILGNIDIDTLCKNIDIQGNNAIRDRIKEVGVILNFNWNSYRDKITKN